MAPSACPFRPGQPIISPEALPGIRKAWFIDMDRPESTIPRGIGIVFLHARDRTVYSGLLPDFVAVEGQTEPEREVVDWYLQELARILPLVREKARRSVEPPTTEALTPLLDLTLPVEVLVPYLEHERTRLWAFWSDPDRVPPPMPVPQASDSTVNPQSGLDRSTSPE